VKGVGRPWRLPWLTGIVSALNEVPKPIPTCGSRCSNEATDRKSDDGYLTEPHIDQASLPGQVVLVLQAAAHWVLPGRRVSALQEARIEPDWISHVYRSDQTQADRRKRAAGPFASTARILSRCSIARQWDLRGLLPGFSEKWSYWTTLMRGIPGFFTPNPLAHAGDVYPLGADHAGYYSTAALEPRPRRTHRLQSHQQRKAAPHGRAAHVRTSQMTYFDSRRCKLT